MEKLFKFLAKPAKLIVIIAFYAAAGFELISLCGMFPTGFIPVLAHLLLLGVYIALYALYPTLLLLNKREAAKYVFGAFLFYWIITTSLNYVDNATTIVAEMGGLVIVASILELIIALGLLAVIVFKLLAIIFKVNVLVTFNKFILLFILIPFFLLFIFALISFIQTGVGWSAYFAIVVNFIAIPLGVVFSYLFLE